jgi:hypothetical protein
VNYVTSALAVAVATGALVVTDGDTTAWIA